MANVGGMIRDMGGRVCVSFVRCKAAWMGVLGKDRHLD